MKYRKLGKTGREISEIGMGLEHLLPHDQSTVTETIKAAVNGGVNYLDCHPGHDYDQRPDPGVYEGYIKLGKAIAGIRDKLCISYIASCQERSADIASVCFEGYLRALNTDRTDVFMIQFCDKMTEYEQVTGDGGLLEYAKKCRTEGKARHIGISTHSSAIAYKAIGSGDFDVIMYPVSPAFDVVTDEDRYKTDDLGTLWDAAYEFNYAEKGGAQPRKSVYIECERNGVGLIAMKPFGGGFIFRVEGNAGFTPLNLISYALTQNGVSTVVPGCQNPREIEEILAYYTCPDDALDFSKAMLNSRWNIKGNCQYCNHCLPCSAGINVGQVNRIIDGGTASEYCTLAVKASSCVKCGECEERCPFGVKITEKMDLAVRLFEKN